ncbi:protein disulfide oxidoreductase [Pasteurellaceae bacterium LIM206]|nr:protein disulfide oxidoreductase [Pasteurellaceae bacterium LIM206]
MLQKTVAKSHWLRRWLKTIVVYGLLFVGLTAAMDYYRKPSEPAQFADQVLYDLHRQPHIIAQLSHQQPMLLYFWGSWCGYCKLTSPAVNKLAQQNIPVLTVALRSGDNQAVENYLTRENYAFPVINDPDGKLSKAWNIQATPTILIIKSGKVLLHTTGLTSYWGLKARLWLANFN